MILRVILQTYFHCVAMILHITIINKRTLNNIHLQKIVQFSIQISLHRSLQNEKEKKKRNNSKNKFPSSIPYSVSRVHCKTFTLNQIYDHKHHVNRHDISQLYVNLNLLISIVVGIREKRDQQLAEENSLIDPSYRVTTVELVGD